MARASGPYSAAFPVNFTSAGDTTRDAFKKHMDEIARIYGILTDFDQDIANTEGITGQLTTHINSTNPHPNWTPSVSWANLTGKPGLNDLSGTLSASKVVGELTNATIATGKVTGLTAFVNGLITSNIPSSTRDGITSSRILDSGYVKFGNGFILQWGYERVEKQSTQYQTKEITFSTSFPTLCYSVIVTALPLHGGTLNITTGFSAVLSSYGTINFKVGITPPNIDDATVCYIAVGK